MSFSELFEHLDPKVAEPLAKAFDRLRRELRQELGATSGEAAAEETAEEAAPAPTAAAALGPDLLEELKHAVVHIDTAETQGEILSALLSGARRFASRSAALLVRPDELAVWDANGFEPVDDGLRELRLTPEAGSAWSAAREGGGAVPMTGADCALLTDPAGVAAPALGVLVPMMLGRRVAALLYADSSEPAASLNLTALQLLTFCAGSVLETLPVRGRGATASLRLAAAGAGSTVAEAAVAPPAPMPEPAPEAEPEPQPEPEPEAEPEPKPEPEPDTQPEPEREPEATDLDPPMEAPAAEELRPLEVSPSDLAAPATPADGFAHEMDFRPPPGIPTIPLDSPPPPAAPEPSETTPVESLTEEIPVEPEAEPAAPPAPRDPQPEPEDAAAPTPEVAPTPEAAPTPPEAGGEPEGIPKIDPESTVVTPPTDIDGPGWAFTRTPSATSREAQREEARRLARLLVTEIKLYNESQVELGRQNQDLYSRLQEDIDRSRQIFDDRVDPDIRGDEPFFDDALVRILAGGNADTLGT